MTTEFNLERQSYRQEGTGQFDLQGFRFGHFFDSSVSWCRHWLATGRSTQSGQGGFDLGALLLLLSQGLLEVIQVHLLEVTLHPLPGHCR